MKDQRPAAWLAAIALMLAPRALRAQPAPAAPLAHASVMSAPQRAACTVVGPPPAALGLSPFYTRYCSAAGIAIVAGQDVPDAALEQAARIVAAMLAPMPAAREALLRAHARVAIIGARQRTTDLPEYAALPPRTNTRARGLGGSTLTSVAEENVLCYEHDRWRGENILVHEFAHTIKQLGLGAVDPGFATRVESARRAAVARGLYRHRYAATDAEEYWAEGVQSYFDVHQTRDPTDVNTREQLRAYDPALFALVDQAFRAAPLPAACPAPAFAPGAVYRLQSVALGAAFALDTANDGVNDPVIAPTGDYSGQRWTLRPVAGGWLRLTNEFLGDARALDTRNDGVFDPAMAPAGAYSGQLWRATYVDRGQYRLTNAFLGEGRSLAVRCAQRCALELVPTAGAPAQFWTASRVH